MVQRGTSPSAYIETAIASRRLLRLVYDGHTREVEPHTYGVTRKGRRALVAYQVRGGSRSGEYMGWKTFHEDEMRNVSMMDDAFVGPRDGYRRDDPAFASIFAQL